MGPTHLVLLGQMTNSGPYALGTVGSNDESGIKKLNPVSIRLFDDNKGKVSVQLLDMGAYKESTAEALFNNINSILSENRVDWKNCVVAGLDNTAVKAGKKKSIMTRVLAKNKNTLISRVYGHIQRFLKKLTLKFLNLDVIDEGGNPAQIDFEDTNNQKSGNVKRGVLFGLILRFLYSVNLIR